MGGHPQRPPASVILHAGTSNYTSSVIKARVIFGSCNFNPLEYPHRVHRYLDGISPKAYSDACQGYTVI